MCDSTEVLKKNKLVFSFESQITSFPSMSLHAGILSGAGRTLQINFNKRPTPILLLAEVQNTGNISRFRSPLAMPFLISSSVSVSFSKNISIRLSSFSAAFSISSACNSVALSISDSGISLISGLPPSLGYL